jgi:recombinational DNA repair ATPase RecF
MGTAKQDYVRFLRWLHELQPVVPENARRFANMILGDFDQIAETASQRHARAMYLAALARRSLATTASDMPAGQDEAQDTEWPWVRLRSLTVGPFRGFVREEVFDLQRRVVLFYGPNGAGKSSLCEAIERAMLGSVEEAGLKRLDEGAYLRNVHVRRFAEPRLTATGHDQRETPVRANADLFRFCFVEKNRIDAFSRIAQRPQGQRAELIAALFGMERFNDFCNRFNDHIDPALVTEPRKQNELRLKREAFARDRATVDGEANRLAEHDAENEAYAEAFAAGTSFARLQEIIGSEEAPARLAELDNLLNAVPASLIGLNRDSLARAFDDINAVAAALRTTTRELGRRASQVSYRTLYGAVIELESGEAGRCPACETPLAQVARNPFDKARDGLRELRDLAELQEQQEHQRRELATASGELRAALAKLSTYLARQDEEAAPMARFLEAIPVRPEGDGWWLDVYLPEAGSANGPPSVAQLLAVADRVSAADKTTSVQLERRAELVRERDDLLARRRHIDQRRQLRQRIVDDAAAARLSIAAFDTTNERLIQEAERERQDIERDAPIRAAYNAFLPLLRRFCNVLPGMLIAGLGDLACDLYNEFNRDDRNEDKLASLHLPLTGDQRIELAFRDTPGRRVDALQVLSEGHIRCLGLAILLAKCISIESPVLIFDDAVNAIDHDHRNGIKETIFTSDRFRAMQILVTCHSPEFIKDIKNSLTPQQRGDSQEYILTHHEGDHHPRVHRDLPSSAYLDKARRDLENFQLRDALGNARRALEMLSNKAWKWLGSHDLGEIRLRLDGPGRPPNLREVCDAIRVKLRDSATFIHVNKQPLFQALEEILSASNLTWTYLNKGTHEEENREEFDRAQVELVVSRLERIDALDLRAGR